MGVTTFPVLCSGPGPHQPATGIVGQADRPGLAGMLCPACAVLAANADAANGAIEASQDANATTLRQRAAAALATNATYLATGSPTAAQVAAQVKALTQECSALIRLTLNLLDSTTGT